MSTERDAEARQELEEWIIRNLDVLAPGASEMRFPVVEDFVLACVVGDAQDAVGEGYNLVGRLSSGHGAYRTHGLLMAVSVAYEQRPPEDD